MKESQFRLQDESFSGSELIVCRHSFGYVSSRFVHIAHPPAGGSSRKRIPT